jgi:hypothetical protein
MQSPVSAAVAAPLRPERRRARAIAAARTASDDLRLFTMTFAAGFLFVTLFIA